jgi:hypothetical protein
MHSSLDEHLYEINYTYILFFLQTLVTNYLRNVKKLGIILR